MTTSLYLAIPFLALLTVVQASVLPHFPIFGMVPQVVALAAVAWGLLRGPNEGVVWAFIAGLFLDLFSSTPMGVSSLALMVAVLVAARLQLGLPVNRVFVPILLSGVASFIFLLLYVVLLQVTGIAVGWGTLADLPPAGLLHAILILPVYWLLYGLERLLNPRPVRV